MGQWFIKKFQKKSAVKCLVLYPEKRLKTFWAIPHDGIVKVADKAFVVNETDFFLSNGIPTYIYDINNVEPKNPYEKDNLGKVMSPTSFDTAISARVAREIFEASAGAMDKATIGLILTGMAIMISGVLGYMILSNIAELSVLVTEIREVLRSIGGM